MAVIEPKRLEDQLLSLERGVDSGFPPALILPNQTAWGVNLTHRGGWVTQRPGLIRHQLNFAGDPYLQAAMTTGYFQGAGTFTASNGAANLALSVSGRIFLINVTAGNAVSEITIPGDPNMPALPKTWFQQAETWLIAGNQLNRTFLYNGASSRRAGPGEVPISGPMAYGRGRLWVARQSLLFGGDLVGNDPALGRTNVIKFTENDFLNEGGAFAIPDGPITGLRFTVNLDTALGENDLLVATRQDIHAFFAPVDRTVWKNLRGPVIRYAAKQFGALANDSMIGLNSDVIYRSIDGVRSLAFARRDFTEWGNSPISRQVKRALMYDTESRLYAGSAVNFDNRMLMTTQPQRDTAHGVWHRGFVVLDYDLVTGMGTKIPPAWEGVWTGIRILHVLTLNVNSVERCFIFALSEAGVLELWELTKGRQFDFDGVEDRQIQSAIETRGFSFNNPKPLKRLMSANLWYDQILGTVSLRAFYRADDSTCWQPWARWSDCVKYTNCDELEACVGYPYVMFQPVRDYVPQERPRIGLPQPPVVPEQQTGGLTCDGHTFQLRLEFSGRIRMKMLEIIGQERNEMPYGDMRNVTCDNTGGGVCPTAYCAGIECCPREDYGYEIGSGADDDGGGGSGYPYPDGGGGGEEPDTPDITYDPDNPTGEPAPPPGTPGTPVVVSSSYCWSFLGGENPNAMLTPEQLACYLRLFDAEVANQIAAYSVAGFTATTCSERKWVFSPSNGSFFAAQPKVSCDPNNSADDVTWLFAGITYAAQVLCLVEN